MDERAGSDNYLADRIQRHLAMEILLVVTTFIFMLFLINEILDWRDVMRMIGKRTTSWCTLSYGYSERNGPAVWKNRYSHHGGVSWKCQSPINIDTCNTIVVDGCPPLAWNCYDKVPSFMRISNKQHTVVLTGNWARCEVPILCGGPLENHAYRFQKACFRWGPDNTAGSEHVIDLEQYALEVQLYHEKVAFGTSTQDNAFAIVSFLYQISGENNPYLDPVIDKLYKIQKDGTSANIPSFPLAWLRGSTKPTYYSYSGSFTHPPCSECVTWLVFSEPMCISCEQLEEFRKLTDPCGQPILTNLRPVQCVNSRNIFCYDA